MLWKFYAQGIFQQNGLHIFHKTLWCFPVRHEKKISPGSEKITPPQSKKNSIPIPLLVLNVHSLAQLLFFYFGVQVKIYQTIAELIIVVLFAYQRSFKVHVVLFAYQRSFKGLSMLITSQHLSNSPNQFFPIK